jgi:predicted regulator of Ras-like GTPase activity (Roadblock/LC7/MglB family)
LPEGIRQAMNGLDPATRSFLIPFTDFENQMRSGKLRFKWSKLQGWCRPEPFAASAADVDVDLPLASLVPLFLEKHKAPDARKKLEVDSRIPDVFAKSSYPAPPPAPAPGPATEPEPIPSAEAAPALEPAPAIPEPEPIPEAASIAVPAAEPESNAEPEPAPEPTPTAEAAPVPTPELAPAPAEPAVPAPAATSEPLPFPVAATMGGISDGPSIAHAPAAATVTPFRVEQPPTGPKPSNPSAQALQRIRALDGVSGAFLATVDGLLIAADLPDGNDNILAAFAPTVFAQLAKYCDMARLGVPLSFDLHLGATNIHVRKTGKIYLGVLSANGRPLPVAELNLIAVTL